MAPIALADDKTRFLDSFFKGKPYEVSSLAGDASSRRYYRLFSNEKSWVLMDWDPFDPDQDHPFLSIQSYFLQHDIKVPDVLEFAPNLGLFILEDLGDLTLERKFWESQEPDNSLSFYKQSLDELIKIHSLSPKEGSCIAFDIEFDQEKFLWEMNYMKKNFLNGLMNIQIDAATDNCFNTLAKTLANLPKVVCHRDFHSRNVMIKMGKVKIIDFQDARMGPRQYDLASIIYDSYVDLDPEFSNKLLNYYLKNTEVSEPPEIFKQNLRLQMIQRCLKACGSFASFYILREDKRYLRYIRPTLKKIVTELKQCPELSPVLNVIESNKLTQIDYLKHVNSSTNRR